MPKPAIGTYPAFYETYVCKVAENNLEDAFFEQQKVINDLFGLISEEKAGYAYAAGKWTIKELLQHVIDTERIFDFRALAFSRKETASIPGFDENSYAEHSNANERTWKSLTDELRAVRTATEMLFKSFNTEMLGRTGIANNNSISVNAIGFIIVGHLSHHKNVIIEKYL